MPHLSTLENVMLGQHHLADTFKEMFSPLGFFSKNPWAKKAEKA